MVEGRDVIENLPKVRNGKIKGWVNIMYGCDKFCTYCIVPYTRGKNEAAVLRKLSRKSEDLQVKAIKKSHCSVKT